MSALQTREQRLTTAQSTLVRHFSKRQLAAEGSCDGRQSLTALSLAKRFIREACQRVLEASGAKQPTGCDQRSWFALCFHSTHPSRVSLQG